MARYNAYGELDQKYLDDLDSTFRGFNNRTRPDGLDTGVLQDSQNLRSKLEGVLQVRDSIAVTSAPLALDDNTAFTIPFYTYGLPDDNTTTSNNISTTSIGTSGTELTLNMDPAENFFVDDTLVFVGAISGLTDYSSGNYLITERAAGYIKIDVPGISGTATGNTTIGAPRLQDSFVTRVYGSCVFADPTNEGEEYIIIAGNSNAVAIKLSDQSTTSITYDGGAIQIGSDVSLIQAFNRVYLFRDGQTALEWNGVLTGSPNFVKVPNGAYTQPKLLDSSNNTTVLNGKVSVNETAHNLETGNTIVVIDSGHTTLADGSIHSITKVDADNFFFYADVDDDASGHSSKYIGNVSQGGGFIHMPAAPFGVLHQDRLVVPYTYTSDSSPVSRDIVDEILLSEPFFPDTFDTQFGLGRMFPGTDDRVVGLFSFTEDKLIVFNRNSVFLIKDTVSLNAASKQLLTQEVGLVARNSVVQVGNQVIFLSDNGVYGLSFQDLYNLRGNNRPLSESIQGTIDRINTDQWHKSVAVYYENRYYIAVPLDSSQENNAILIYNFLNGLWESVDSVGSTDRSGNAVNWDIQNLLVAGDGNDRAVYAINSLGGVHRLEANSSSDDDQVITQIGGSTQLVPIPASMTTRQFNFRDIQRKKWNSFEIQAESNGPLSSDFSINFITENIDDTINVGLLSDFNGGSLAQDEDVSIRGRIGNRRAYGCSCKIDSFTGKPKIKVIKVTGGLAFNSLQKAE